MLRFLKSFFGTKPTVAPCPEAPYKVEAPKTTVGAVPLGTQYEQATEAVVKSVAKKPAAKRPAGEKKTAAKPRTTRAKKQAS
jgi:hypothetical protein